MRGKAVFATALLAVCLAGAAYGQNGAIQGTLVDATNAAIPNAKVSATDVVKSLVVREAVSSGDGVFRIAPLAPGRYTVKITAAGMKPFDSRILSWMSTRH